MTRCGRVWTLLGLLALLVAAGPLAAQQSRQQRVQPRPQRSGERDQSEQLLDRFALRVTEALHLDDEQSRRLAEELHVSRAARERLTNQRRTIRRQLNQLVRSPSADEARIGRLLDEFLELYRREAELNIEEQARLAEFLTPLQRARLFYLRQRLAQQALDRDRQQTDRLPDRGLQERDPDPGF